jgi:hypothetical protein
MAINPYSFRALPMDFPGYRQAIGTPESRPFGIAPV